MTMIPSEVIDKAAISGILGSISISCWIVVFTPQLYENFMRKSADGLSLTFIVLWLAGDVFNVLGAVMQQLLPTMIILAVYYTAADIVLILQYFFYHNKKTHVNVAHLSPATPLVLATDEEEALAQDTSSYGAVDYSSSSSYSALDADNNEDDESSRSGTSNTDSVPKSRAMSIFSNCIVVSLVILSGILGWYASNRHAAPRDPHIPEDDVPVEFNAMAQFFGYLCAVLYLGSRVPQIALNFRRKSCEGISFLFFLFACLGNLTYVGSIFAAGISRDYLVINASWLLGSIGTLFLDFVIFLQFWIYSLDDV